MSRSSEATAATGATPFGRAAPGSRYFVTTRWTVVLAAGRKDAPEAGEALDQFCRVYWYPL